ISYIQADSFALYARELLQWNKKKNLTSITDPREIGILHFADSAYLSLFIKETENKYLIDSGSGGGFPGIVIKILMPELNVTLLDSSSKKINFLKYISRELKLGKVDFVNQRIEDFAKQNSEQFDYGVSRAFTSADKFYEMITPCIKKQGVIFAMKGPGTKDEIAKLKSWFAGKNENKEVKIEVSEYILPVVNHKRTIISLTH
ncbi:MAG: 16S rRNA (guanine(527)-N(7))-methyltransferase RsmG, partial [Thermodesulfobacteriota bacterium]